MRCPTRCENMLSKDAWPYTYRCTEEDTVKPRRVAVGRAAGTWDLIYETHSICDRCATLIDLEPTDKEQQPDARPYTELQP